ncbi:hypothetical protein GCM10028786_22580 [Flaviaesturariibacter terrae]
MPQSPPDRDSLIAGIRKLNCPDASIYGIYFADTLTGYCGGQTGVFRTTNGGQSWTSIFAMPGGSRLNHIKGWGDRVTFTLDGIATGSNLYSTRNGSAVHTSSYAPLPNQLGLFFSDIAFVSADTALIASDYHIWRSTDGGVTASLLYNAGTRSTTELLSFVNSRTGWCMRFGYLYRTDDGGQTWAPRFSWGDLCGGLQFLNANTGYFASGTHLYRSNDGAQTATLLENFGSATYPSDLHFFDELRGFVLVGGNLWYTGNGCQTWTLAAHMASGYLNRLYFTDEHNGWVGGDSTLLRVRL